ncbi:hypothetical protein VE03_08266 [Pseudogymnoascus sp. 23342-1-I1]|nr:hypothetical protein VE03_08266 [Pseudogymnoascus sp. 23342-1-I1]
MAGSSDILTAIHKAPRLSLVNYLLQVELFRRQNMPDKTLLDIAAIMGYDALVTVLLKRKPSPSVDSMLSAMAHASAYGNNSVIKLFLRSKTKILDPQFTFRNKSPLAEAAKRGHMSTVKLLLASGVSLEKSQWCSDRIAVIEAAENGYEDIFKLLLTRRPAGFKSRDHDSIALRFAAKAGYYDIVEMLLGKGGQDGLDHEAGKRLAVSTIDSQDEDGRTALHYAVMAGHAKTVSLLLGCKANLEVQSALELFEPSLATYNVTAWGYCKNWTALHFATAYGNVEIAATLLHHGANVDAVDSHGQTSLHLASTNGTIKIIRVLLDHNPMLEATDNVGARALHKAAASGHLDIVRLLADQNCNIMR